MARQIAFLRGINLGARRQLPMPALKELAESLGFEDPFTHLRSGNLVYSTTLKPPDAARKLERAIEAEFGFAVPVQARTAVQLKKAIEANPLADVATDPKKFLLVMLSGKPKQAAIDQFDDTAFAPERIAFAGDHAYLWLPNGIHKSKLGTLGWDKRLAVDATSRNWDTVTKLLELASN